MNDRSPLDELAKLADLKAKGTLSEQEFQDMKAKLLADANVAASQQAGAQSPADKGYTFTQAIESGFKKYATFAGRAPRSAYWFWVLFTVIASFATTILDLILGTTAGPTKTGLINTLFVLATFLPGIAVWVRRLHDINRSGWWAWMVLIPIVGWILLLVWTCLRGTRGDNRYGPDPLA